MHVQSMDVGFETQKDMIQTDEKQGDPYAYLKHSNMNYLHKAIIN
jgi:hypothetical protein